MNSALQPATRAHHTSIQSSSRKFMCTYDDSCSICVGSGYTTKNFTCHMCLPCWCCFLRATHVFFTFLSGCTVLIHGFAFFSQCPEVFF